MSAYVCMYVYIHIYTYTRVKLCFRAKYWVEKFFKYFYLETGNQLLL